MRFELDVEDALKRAYNDLPADLGQGGLLEQAFYEWMEQCVTEAGYPDIVFNLPVEPDGYRADFGLPHEEFLDLRHSCAPRGADFPRPNPDARDEMLGRMRRHYLHAADEFVRLSDVAEIPIEHHDGDAHPLEESHIGHCLEWEIAERESCAEYYRVDLSEEQKSAPVPVRDPVDESGPYPLVGQPCGLGEAPGLVIIHREGNYCDMFENLELIINYPEKVESQGYASNFSFGGQRPLNCPDHWVIDDEDKCRYPRPEEADLREAFVEDHPEQAGAYGMGLHSSRYPDKD